MILRLPGLNMKPFSFSIYSFRLKVHPLPSQGKEAERQTREKMLGNLGMAHLFLFLVSNYLRPR